MRAVFVGVIILILLSPSAMAQTSTPTPTITPAAEYVYSEVAGQMTRFDYTLSAASIIKSVLLIAILFSLWAWFILKELED